MASPLDNNGFYNYASKKINPNKVSAIPNAGFWDRTKDLGVDVARAGIGAGEAVVGLASLATGGVAGKGFQELGYNPEETHRLLSEFYSDERKQEQRDVSKAFDESFLGGLGTAVSEPAVAIGSVVQSLPSMFLGRGLATKMVPALGISPNLAAGLGEGLLTAGTSFESTRKETGEDYGTLENYGYSLGAGALTAGIGMGSSKLGRMAGVDDIDIDYTDPTAMLKRKMITGATLKGAGFEAGEELLQSGQEQSLQNLATGKPWDKGVSEAMGMGAISGGLMGGPMAGYKAIVDNEKVKIEDMFHETKAALGSELGNTLTEQAEVLGSDIVGGKQPVSLIQGAPTIEEQKILVDVSNKVNQTAQAVDSITQDKGLMQDSLDKKLNEASTIPSSVLSFATKIKADPSELNSLIVQVYSQSKNASDFREKLNATLGTNTQGLAAKLWPKLKEERGSFSRVTVSKLPVEQQLEVKKLDDEIDVLKEQLKNKTLIANRPDLLISNPVKMQEKQDRINVITKDNDEVQKFYTPEEQKTAVKIVANPWESQSKGEGVSVYRKWGSKQHFGNPFSSEKIAGTVPTANTAESVKMFKEWLAGKHSDIEPERQAWVIDQINKGVLDGKTLLYGNTKATKNKEESHADALAEFVNNRLQKEEVFELDEPEEVVRDDAYYDEMAKHYEELEAAEEYRKTLTPIKKFSELKAEEVKALDNSKMKKVFYHGGTLDRTGPSGGAGLPPNGSAGIYLTLNKKEAAEYGPVKAYRVIVNKPAKGKERHAIDGFKSTEVSPAAIAEAKAKGFDAFDNSEGTDSAYLILFDRSQLVEDDSDTTNIYLAKEGTGKQVNTKYHVIEDIASTIGLDARKMYSDTERMYSQSENFADFTKKFRSAYKVGGTSSIPLRVFKSFELETRGKAKPLSTVGTYQPKLSSSDSKNLTVSNFAYAAKELKQELEDFFVATKKMFKASPNYKTFQDKFVQQFGEKAKKFVNASFKIHKQEKDYRQLRTGKIEGGKIISPLGQEITSTKGVTFEYDYLPTFESPTVIRNITKKPLEPNVKHFATKGEYLKALNAYNKDLQGDWFDRAGKKIDITQYEAGEELYRKPFNKVWDGQNITVTVKPENGIAFKLEVTAKEMNDFWAKQPKRTVEDKDKTFESFMDKNYDKWLMDTQKIEAMEAQSLKQRKEDIEREDDFEMEQVESLDEFSQADEINRQLVEEREDTDDDYMEGGRSFSRTATKGADALEGIGMSTKKAVWAKTVSKLWDYETEKIQKEFEASKKRKAIDWDAKFQEFVEKFQAKNEKTFDRIYKELLANKALTKNNEQVAEFMANSFAELGKDFDLNDVVDYVLEYNNVEGKSLAALAEDPIDAIDAFKEGLALAQEVTTARKEMREQRGKEKLTKKQTDMEPKTLVRKKSGEVKVITKENINKEVESTVFLSEEDIPFFEQLGIQPIEDAPANDSPFEGRAVRRTEGIPRKTIPKTVEEFNSLTPKEREAIRIEHQYNIFKTIQQPQYRIARDNAAPVLTAIEELKTGEKGLLTLGEVDSYLMKQNGTEDFKAITDKQSRINMIAFILRSATTMQFVNKSNYSPFNPNVNFYKDVSYVAENTQLIKEFSGGFNPADTINLKEWQQAQNQPIFSLALNQNSFLHLASSLTDDLVSLGLLEDFIEARGISKEDYLVNFTDRFNNRKTENDLKTLNDDLYVMRLLIAKKNLEINTVTNENYFTAYQQQIARVLEQTPQSEVKVPTEAELYNIYLKTGGKKDSVAIYVNNLVEDIILDQAAQLKAKLKETPNKNDLQSLVKLNLGLEEQQILDDVWGGKEIPSYVSFTSRQRIKAAQSLYGELLRASKVSNFTTDKISEIQISSLTASLVEPSLESYFEEQPTVNEFEKQLREQHPNLKIGRTPSFIKKLYTKIAKIFDADLIFVADDEYKSRFIGNSSVDGRNKIIINFKEKGGLHRIFAHELFHALVFKASPKAYAEFKRAVIEVAGQDKWYDSVKSMTQDLGLEVKEEEILAQLFSHVIHSKEFYANLGKSFEGKGLAARLIGRLIKMVGSVNKAIQTEGANFGSDKLIKNEDMDKIHDLIKSLITQAITGKDRSEIYVNDILRNTGNESFVKYYTPSLGNVYLEEVKGWLANPNGWLGGMWRKIFPKGTKNYKDVMTNIENLLVDAVLWIKEHKPQWAFSDFLGDPAQMKIAYEVANMSEKAVYFATQQAAKNHVDTFKKVTDKQLVEMYESLRKNNYDFGTKENPNNNDVTSFMRDLKKRGIPITQAGVNNIVAALRDYQKITDELFAKLQAIHPLANYDKLKYGFVLKFNDSKAAKQDNEFDWTADDSFSQLTGRGISVEGYKANAKNKIAKGFIPKELNPNKVFLEFVRDATRVILVREAIEKGLTTNAKNGEPIMKMFESSNEAREAGYYDVDDNAFKVFADVQITKSIIEGIEETQDLKAEMGRIYMQKDAARMFKTLMGRDIIRRTKTGELLMKVKNAMTSIEFAFSTFHAFTITQEALASNMSWFLKKNKGASLWTKKAGFNLKQISSDAHKINFMFEAAAGDKTLLDKPAFMNELKSLLKTDDIDVISILDMYFFSGGLAKQSGDLRSSAHALGDMKYTNASEGYFKISEDGTVSKTGKSFIAPSQWKANAAAIKESFAEVHAEAIKNEPNKKIAAMFKVAKFGALESTTAWLMEYAIPQIKFATFVKEYTLKIEQQKEAIANGTTTKEAIAIDTMKFLEDRFGEVNWRNMWMNPTLKTGLQFLFRSFTWFTGSFKALTKAGIDLGKKGWFTVKGEQYELTEKGWWGINALLSHFMTTGLIATAFAIAGAASGGEEVPDDEDIPRITKWMFPRMDKFDPSSRVSIPSYITEGYKIMMHLGLLGEEAQFSKLWTGRVNSLISKGYEALWTGEDWRGVQITDENDIAAKRALDTFAHMFIVAPISVSTAFKAFDTKGIHGAKQIIGSFAGMTGAPASAMRSEATNKAFEIRREENKGRKVSQRDMDIKEELNLATHLYKMGDKAPLNALLSEGIISQRQYKNALAKVPYIDNRNNPDYIDPLSSAIKGLTINGALEVWGVMSDNEKKKHKKEIIKKYLNMMARKDKSEKFKKEIRIEMNELAILR